MRLIVASAMAAGLIANGAPPSAGILGTPAILVNASTDQRVMCIVANRNTAPLVDVEIRIYGGSGSMRPQHGDVDRGRGQRRHHRRRVALRTSTA